MCFLPMVHNKGIREYLAFTVPCANALRKVSSINYRNFSLYVSVDKFVDTRPLPRYIFDIRSLVVWNLRQYDMPNGG